MKRRTHIIVVFGLILVGQPLAGAEPASTTTATTTQSSDNSLVWRKRAFEYLSAAPERDDPVMGMLILGEYAGIAGDTDSVRSVLTFLESHRSQLWSVERWPDDDPRFARFAAVCYRMNDRDAYERCTNLIRDTLATRSSNADLVWRDLVWAYGMGGMLKQAEEAAEHLKEPDWRADGFAHAAYLAGRNGYADVATKLQEDSDAADANDHRRVANKSLRVVNYLIAESDFAAASKMLEEGGDAYGNSYQYVQLSVAQYRSGDKPGSVHSLARASELAAPGVGYPRMDKQMWAEIARAQWLTGDPAASRKSLERAMQGIAPADAFDRWDAYFYLAGCIARTGDTTGALATLDQAETTARENDRNLDEPGYASNYRDVIEGLADAGDTSAAMTIYDRVPGLHDSPEIAASFAAAYARAGNANEAAVWLAKVPRFITEQPLTFMSGLANAVTQVERPSQTDRALAVRRAAFSLAQSGKVDLLAPWIEALPTKGDRAMAALGVSEFQVRGYFNDYLRL